MNTGFAMAFVLGTLVLFLEAARFARATEWLGPEASRKFLHIGMGLVCMTFPWLFSSATPIAELAIIAAIVLVLLRIVPSLRERLGCAMNDINRISYGEFTFIVGVTAAFALADRNGLAYVLSVAILTFADSAAAIIGRRIGSHRFNDTAGAKSLEGSLGFLAVSVACIAIPLSFLSVPAALPVGVFAGVVLMMVEAVTSRGLDNVAIPVVGTLLLRGLTGTFSGAA